MTIFSRLFLGLTASVLLTNCGLINSALRLAPMALMFVEEDGAARVPDSYLERGAKIEGRGIFAPSAVRGQAAESALAAR
ncbi:MAG: hypothetical protein R3F13_14390 [Prosthecobacter sp.]